MPVEAYSSIAPYNNRDICHPFSRYYFHSQIETSPCSLSEARYTQAEVLRVGWVIGNALAYKVRDFIGHNFLNNIWQGHPYFFSLQNSFNKLSNKISRLTNCFSDPIFSAIQKA